MFSLLLLALACGAGKTCSGQDVRDGVALFPYPEVPAVMTVPEDRMAYLLEHFWERYDFRDTALLGRREITEQGFADFVGLLMQSGFCGAADAVGRQDVVAAGDEAFCRGGGKNAGGLPVLWGVGRIVPL